MLSRSPGSALLNNKHTKGQKMSVLWQDYFQERKLKLGKILLEMWSELRMKYFEKLVFKRSNRKKVQ